MTESSRAENRVTKSSRAENRATGSSQAKAENRATERNRAKSWATESSRAEDRATGISRAERTLAQALGSLTALVKGQGTEADAATLEQLTQYYAAAQDVRGA